MEIPAAFAAEQAVLRQNIAMSVIKQAADADKQILKILEQSLTTVQDAGRGTHVNITA